MSGPAVTSELDPKWFLPSRHLREEGRGPCIQLTNTPRQKMEQAQGRGGRRLGELTSPGFLGKASQVSTAVGPDQAEEEEGELALPAGSPVQAKLRCGRTSGATEGQEQSRAAARSRTWSPNG